MGRNKFSRLHFIKSTALTKVTLNLSTTKSTLQSQKINLKKNGWVYWVRYITQCRLYRISK